MGRAANSKRARRVSVRAAPGKTMTDSIQVVAASSVQNVIITKPLFGMQSSGERRRWERSSVLDI